jgi:hypothetical protein
MRPHPQESAPRTPLTPRLKLTTQPHARTALNLERDAQRILDLAAATLQADVHAHKRACTQHDTHTYKLTNMTCLFLTHSMACECPDVSQS